MPSTFPLLHTNNREINQLQQNVAGVLNPIAKEPILSSNLLQSVPLLMGDNVVQHGLGRKLLGWFPVGADAVTALYDKQATNASPAQTLILNASAGATVSLYVF